MTLTSNTIIEVLIQVRKDSLSARRDYLFQSKISIELKSKNDIFTHIINAIIIFVQVRNVITESVVLLRYVKLRKVQNYKKKEYYLIISENIHLARKSKKAKNLFRLVLTVVINDIIVLIKVVNIS